MLRCKYCVKLVEGEGFHPNKLQQIRWNLVPRVLAFLFLSFLFVLRLPFVGIFGA